ncbi:hypothetical protein [Streptomyces sp. CMB-StM0423]|uniref:hypothetical protein n=1 Tax=Streptomyces sp. CMB-StM0423 TaxID=2059884 RepID=UPI000C706666|nr:hypothetical protein [Streptomyces sp. CMB-StM0423]AUH40768.1 hypothetical protein CXR04_11360 [Streptomyces sp. CMB-StM0423]
MAVDPQDSDTFDEPARRTGPDGSADAPAERDAEAPEADVAEQRAEVEQGDEDVTPGERHGDDVNPADAAEQARVVEGGEDEYR